MLSISKLRSFSSSEQVSRHLTLRHATTDYRNAGGRCWVDANPPELSCGVSADQMPSMAIFDNAVGHIVGLRTATEPTETESKIMCLPVRSATTVIELLQEVLGYVTYNVAEGNLWAPEGLVVHTRSESGIWTQDGLRMQLSAETVLETLYHRKFSPLSLCTSHAALEAEEGSDNESFSSMYAFTRNAAPSCGLYGTANNNQNVDMSPFEPRDQPDMVRRQYLNEYTGFICAGHTSHTTEAGRTRRVTCDTRVRIMSRDLVDTLELLIERLGKLPKSGSTWTLFCMGIYCETDDQTVIALCSYHRLLSVSDPTPFSVYIDTESRLVTISISSGVLVKLCSNGKWGDNVEVHFSDRVRTSASPRIDTTGRDMLRACMSLYFNCVPFIEQDRAPRPTITSGQTVQAVCAPYCPATAQVSPNYVFKPLVTTPTYAAVMDSPDQDIADMQPGENLSVLYLNMEENHEDAIVVSKRYINMGGFSTTSICKYSLPQTEYVPPVGSLVCGVVCPWWKSPCPTNCKHTKEYILPAPGKPTVYQLGATPSAVVTERKTTSSGELTVFVRSYQELQDGDKISTGHGQKGTVNILPYDSMPVCVMVDGQTVIPDMVFAMSSIVTRQTSGQLYETMHSLQALRECTVPLVSYPGDRPDLSEEVHVIKGHNGEWYTTVFANPETGQTFRRRTKATLGYVRTYNQTQMTRERAFTSHKAVSKGTLRTPVRRARGGGVKFSEMSIQGAVASGLVSCVDEIVSRGDQVICNVCPPPGCQRLGLLCVCTEPPEHVSVIFNYDLVTLDITTAIIHNASFKYKIEANVPAT